MQSEEVREKHKQIILEKYNCENVFQLESVKEKNRQNLNINYNRPTVLEIRKYRDKFKLNLGRSWFWKPQEFLDNLLAELKLTYNEDHSRQILDSKEKHHTTVLEIRKYRDKFKLNLGINWHYKSQEFLDTLLTELKLSYDLECPRLILDSKDKTKNTLLKKYGYDNPNKVPEIKEKGILTRHNLSHRPTVLLITKYRDKFKLNLGRNWHYKSQEFLDVLLAELKLTYDLESPSQIIDSKEKKRQSRIFLSNQPIALEILKYKEKYGLKLGSYWMYKPQEILDGILAELKLSYGEISENI